MGKEQTIGVGSLQDIEQITSLAKTIRSNTPGHNINLRESTAIELYSMAKASSERILTSLTRLHNASVQHRFDQSEYAVVRRDVLHQVRSDPVYTAADAFYKATGGEGLSVIAEAEKQAQEDQLQPHDKLYEHGGVNYSGVMARAIRLLTGAGKGHPLDLDTLAPLMYPEELFADTQRTKAQVYINKRVRTFLMQNPLAYKLTIKQDGNSDTSVYEVQATKQIESEGEPKPSVSLQVHSGGEYLFLNDTFISFYQRTGVPVARHVHDGLKILAFLNDHPGKWMSNQEVIADFSKDEAPIKIGEAHERMSMAKKWLEKTLVIEGKPLVAAIRNKEFSYYGIMNFDLAMTKIDRPYAEVVEDALAQDPNFVSKEEFDYTSHRVEQNDFITLPDGKFLLDNDARLAYLLLYYAPRRLYFPHLEELLVDKESEAVTHRPVTKMVKAIRRIFAKHLPGVTVAITTDFGESFVHVENYDPDLEVPNMFKKTGEHTLYEEKARKDTFDWARIIMKPYVAELPPVPQQGITGEPVAITTEPPHSSPLSEQQLIPQDMVIAESSLSLLDPLLDPHFYATMSHQDSKVLRAQTDRMKRTLDAIANGINETSWNLLFSSTLRTRYSKSNGMSNFATRLIHLGQTLLHERTYKQRGEDANEITGVDSKRFTDFMDYITANMVLQEVKHRIEKLERIPPKKVGPSNEVVSVKIDPDELKLWISLGFRPGSAEFNALRQGVPLAVLQQWFSEGVRPGSGEFKTRETAYVQEKAAKQQIGKNTTQEVSIETAGGGDTTEYKALKEQQARTEVGLEAFAQKNGLTPLQPIITQLLPILRDPNVSMRILHYRQLDLTGIQEFFTGQTHEDRRRFIVTEQPNYI